MKTNSKSYKKRMKQTEKESRVKGSHEKFCGLQLNGRLRVRLIKKGRLEQRHEGVEEGSHAAIWEKSVLGERNRSFKSPTVGVGSKEPQRRPAVTGAKLAKRECNNRGG